MADEAYAIAALRMPWGNHDSKTARSPAGVVVVSLMGVPHREATRVARRRSICACRECWPERRRFHGAEGAATSAWAGAGALAPCVTGTGPGPVDHHG
jgi:hypothetical protein